MHSSPFFYCDEKNKIEAGFNEQRYNQATINCEVRDGLYGVFRFKGPKEEIAKIFQYVLITLNPSANYNIENIAHNRKKLTIEVLSNDKPGLIAMFRYLAAFHCRYTEVSAEFASALEEANSKIEKNEALPEDLFKTFPKHLQESIILDNKYYFEKLDVDIPTLKSSSRSSFI